MHLMCGPTCRMRDNVKSQTQYAYIDYYCYNRFYNLCTYQAYILNNKMSLTISLLLLLR